jgi:anti-anti-sigma factor
MQLSAMQLSAMQLSEIVCPYTRLDITTVPKFRQELNSLIQQKPLVLLINLKNVEQMDSSGLGCLVSSLRKIREVGGEMALCSVSGQVTELFELTNVNRIFKIVPPTSSP